MPYNFTQKEFYSIDYRQLLNTCLSESTNNLFHSKRMRKKYFKKWIKKLKQADSKRKKQHYPNKTDEYFEFTVPYNTQNITMIFSITNLLQQLPTSNKKNTELIPTNFFLGQQAKLLWTPTTNFNATIPLKNDPIIAIEYLYNYTNFLVIDGNTRLTKWTKEKTVIPTFCITVQNLINSNVFLNEFDKLHYLFRYDMVNLANFQFKNHFDDTQLLELSLL